MRQIKPVVPDDCRVVGELYGGKDAPRLSEDMIEVILPNDIMVAAGWYPDNAPDGRYRVTVMSGLRNLRDPIETSDIDEAAMLVQAYVGYFRGPGILVSETGEVTHTFDPIPDQKG